MRRIINEVRERARRILEEKRDKLEALARRLLEKEVLGPRDLVEILGPRPYGDYPSPNGKDAEELKDLQKGEPASSSAVEAPAPQTERPESSSAP